MNLRSLVFVVVGLSVLPVLLATDWPQWRGPNHDDISAEKGLLKDWPAGGPKLSWEAKGLGAGYSSISIFGDRIFGGVRWHGARDELRARTAGARAVADQRRGQPADICHDVRSGRGRL